MNVGIILLQLVLLGSPSAGNDPGQKIACHFQGATFTDFCEAIQKETGITVFYKADWVKDLKVNIQSDSISILSAVNLALSGSDFKAYIWHDNLVVMPRDALIDKLPDFDTQTNGSATSSQQSAGISPSEERYLTGRKQDEEEIITVGKPGKIKSGSRVSVMGRIKDEDSGEPVVGATLFIEELKTGIATDLSGFLTIVVPVGKYNVQFEHIGNKKKHCQLIVLSEGSFTISLKKTVIEMQEVVIYGDKQMNMRLKDAGLEKISMRAIKELPMMMGERDILKVSVTLPGIVSEGEGATGLNVRGGSSDQNAFYLNKIPIYNTAHLFGFLPAFNSDIIKDFSIYKGYIPAQYGGRLSSVFNIITRQGNRKHFTAHGGISPVSGNIVLEGPIKKDTCSFLISARSTYSDWILAAIKDPDIRQSHAWFNDLSASVNYDIQKTQIALFAYHSKDQFKLSDINRYQYANNGVSLSFSHNYTNLFRSEFSLVGSQYSFSTVDNHEVSSAYKQGYKMGHYEAKLEFKHLLSDQHSLNYGAGMIFYKLNRGTVEPYGDSSFRKRTDLTDEQGLESSLFISDAYEINRRFTASLGLRYTLFTPLGPESVYHYQPGMPMEIKTISDTVLFTKNKPIKWYSEPEIRASLNIKTDAEGSIKIAFNQMHQNLFMLNNSIVIAPNTQWKLADYHLAPSMSNQVSLGVFRTMPKSYLETSVEVFYKLTSGTPEFKDGADFLDNPLPETSILQGSQKAWGVEFFLKRSSRKLEGWLSYTYSHSIIQVNGDKDWDKINGGFAYPANHDIPHSMNMVLTYHVNRRITFSSIITYQTGKPVTYPVAVYYVDGLPYLDFSKRNAYRIPDYFRADGSITLEGNLKMHKLIHSLFTFSVYNATGRANAYSVFFRTENGNIRSYQYSVIGVPIFTITWVFKLGNYASE
ncbi:MAG: TonB-dependent receptor [Bacteroidetes bacterium]|nr:TonB-dependent receptor [Bacteroidota bacterium]